VLAVKRGGGGVEWQGFKARALASPQVRQAQECLLLGAVQRRKGNPSVRLPGPGPGVMTRQAPEIEKGKIANGDVGGGRKGPDSGLGQLQHPLTSNKTTEYRKSV